MRTRVLLIPTIITLLLLSGCRSTPSTTSRVVPRQIERIEQKEVDGETLKAEGLLIEAKMQQEAGNEMRAKALYDTLLLHRPDCAAAHYELAFIAADADDLDDALEHALAASSIHPENVWYWLLLSDLYTSRNESKPLPDVWEKIVALQPDRVEHYKHLSNAYLINGDGERAVATLNRIEKQWGISEEVSLQKEKIWEAIGQPQKAMKEVEALAKAMPENESYNAMVAEAYMRQQDYKHAKPYYDKILEQHPENEYIHISIANYYKLTGDMEAGIRELSTGLAHPSLSCKDRIQILTTYFTSEEFYDTYATATYPLTDSLMHLCDDSVNAGLFYADLLMRRGRYHEAYPWIRSYLAQDSSIYEAWEALLICESMDDSLQSRIPVDAMRACWLFPFHTLPHYLMALHHHGEKQYAEALQELERCVKLGFRKGYLKEECLGLMAECYYRTDQKEKAWQYFEEVLQINPENVGVLNNYAYYLCEEHNVTHEQLLHAKTLSQKAISMQPDNATFLDTYAWILHRLGRDREALPYMKRAIELDKEKSDTLNHHYQSILGNQ